MPISLKGSKRICTCSEKAKRRLINKGFAVVSIAFFEPNGSVTFTLERGSDWSRKLGSR